MTTLNPLAVANADLLRELIKEGADRAANVSELARRLDRDESNLRKTLKTLDTARLLFANTLRLSGTGIEQLEAIDRAEGQGGEPGSPPAAPAAGMLALYHAQILPDPGNARRDWDSEEAKADLDALREDLLLNGLLQNLVVRLVPAGDLQGVSIERTDAAGARHVLPLYRLVGGERRWRAIAIAISDGDWPEDRPIPCRELAVDDLGCRLAALAENIQRRNLNPIEKARAFEGLAEAGLTNQQIAERIVATPEHVQQHRRFLQLDESDQQRMTLSRDDPRHLSVREARQKLARQSEVKPLDLPPEQRLLFAEILHSIRARTSYSYESLAVGSAALDDAALAALVAANLIHPPALLRYGSDIGRYTIRLHYNAHPERTFRWFISSDAAARDAGLTEEQNAAGDGFGSGYVTAWLNAPFDITPEGQMLIETAAAEAAVRAEQQAQHQARLAGLKERHEAARAAQMALCQAAASVESPPAASLPDLPDLFAQLDHPLPWAVTTDGTIVDANRETIDQFEAYFDATQPGGHAIAALTVLAVNTAAGFATPDPIDLDAEDAALDAEPDPDEFADDGADDRHPGEGRD